MDNRLKKKLRQIAHHLDVVVSVGDHGVSDAVVAETNRALDDHELIKVRVHSGEREDRSALIDQLTEACGAEAVQKIGKIVVLYRANPEADPRLSNLQRAGFKG